MRHSLASPLSWLCLGVCAGLLAACEVPGAGLEADSALSPLGTTTLAEATPPVGWPTQGQMLHASSLESVSFLGASLNDRPISNLHLEKGELVGEMAFSPTPTPSLQACTSSSSGTTRNCGWSWAGVGTCLPQTKVHLGAGGCGLGSCTGNAMVRVCTDAASCESANSLTSSDDACGTSCPDAYFLCPASGTYTVLTGPHQSGDSSSVQLAASNGQFPGHRIVRGKDLLGARLRGSSSKEDIARVDVYLTEITNAQDVPLDDGTPWRARNDTFLYALKLIPWDTNETQRPTESCAPPGNNPQEPRRRWAVPLNGVYKESTGELVTTDPSRFTFGCNSGVIAKCYRWGYMPWLDAASAPSDQATQTHWACTRMARADYCGNGQFHTQDGTHIAFWDRLTPYAHARPAAGTIPAEMPFEAGWNTSGAVCLSHARWATMPPPPSNCPLVAPSYDDKGTEIPCSPVQGGTAPGVRCPTVCDTPEEAAQYEQAANPLRLFNHSGLNGVDGGVPDAG